MTLFSRPLSRTLYSMLTAWGTAPEVYSENCRFAKMVKLQVQEYHPGSGLHLVTMASNHLSQSYLGGRVWRKLWVKVVLFFSRSRVRGLWSQPLHVMPPCSTSPPSDPLPRIPSVAGRIMMPPRCPCLNLLGIIRQRELTEVIKFRIISLEDFPGKPR